MLFYVAGSSREIPRVREAQRRLRAAGHEITHDWTVAVEQFGSDGAGQERVLSDAELARYAADDLRAIDRAHCVLVLWPTTPSVGVFVELGYAIKSGARVVVSGGDRFWCALLRDKAHLRGRHRVAANDGEAIGWLLGEAA